MKATQERGIRIPEDISVIGFDDTYLSKMMGVSSIHQPIEKMVETAIRILHDRIEKSISAEIMSILLEPTLVERRSSI